MQKKDTFLIFNREGDSLLKSMQCKGNLCKHWMLHTRKGCEVFSVEALELKTFWKCWITFLHQRYWVDIIRLKLMIFALMQKKSFYSKCLFAFLERSVCMQLHMFSVINCDRNISVNNLR